jgi:hypothetical protein
VAHSCVFACLAQHLEHLDKVEFVRRGFNGIIFGEWSMCFEEVSSGPDGVSPVTHLGWACQAMRP